MPQCNNRPHYCVTFFFFFPLPFLPFLPPSSSPAAADLTALRADSSPVIASVKERNCLLSELNVRGHLLSA